MERKRELIIRGGVRGTDLTSFLFDFMFICDRAKSLAFGVDLVYGRSGFSSFRYFSCWYRCMSMYISFPSQPGHWLPFLGACFLIAGPWVPGCLSTFKLPWVDLETFWSSISSTRTPLVSRAVVMIN